LTRASRTAENRRITDILQRETKNEPEPYRGAQSKGATETSLKTQLRRKVVGAV
jgi:hypothetical protein